jgi:hypothetical protein
MSLVLRIRLSTGTVVGALAVYPVVRVSVVATVTAADA